MNRMRVERVPREVHRRLRDWRSGREERRFQTGMRTDAQAPELVISPHLDDAVLDCWSLLASDRDVNVVNVFAGVPARGALTLWDSITGAAESAERARERIAEDAIALRRAHRAPLNLNLLDAQYRKAPPVLRLAELDDALAARVKSASRVYVPAGIGGHPDHVFVRRYRRMLLRAGMPVVLYAELPYCVLHGWPSWVDGRAAEPNRNVDPFWLSFFDGVPEIPALSSAHVERLDQATASDKLAAMRCYATQLPSLSYGARGLLADPAIHGFEVRWELRNASMAALPTHRPVLRGPRSPHSRAQAIGLERAVDP